MSNLAYNRSTKRERELVNYYRAKGWHACRSAGSKSQWDVYAYNPLTGEVILTQIKTKKGGRTITDKVLSEQTAKVTTIWRTYA
jgi:Holliday junction resolvase